MWKHVSGVVLALYLCGASPSAAFEEDALASVVSVLPVWPGHLRGGEPDTPLGAAPEGSAVAVLPGGYLATAFHVVARATEITVRLHDGRRFQASLIGGDAPTDIALLKIGHDLPAITTATEPPLGAKVCAVGNQFGLGLSVSCGVVSAVRRTAVGFNPVEDFLQTDAVVNPGSSGGPLLDSQGHMVGMISAIFTKESDANIGVNFATSTALLLRVVEDLAADGRVSRARAGFRVANLSAEERTSMTGAKVIAVSPDSAAEAGGLVFGDVVVEVDGRRVRQARDVNTAIQLRRPGDTVSLEILRADGQRKLSLILAR